MENFSLEARERIAAHSNEPMNLVQFLMENENISQEEAQAALGFHFEATNMVFKRTVNPYNLFSKEVATERKHVESPEDGKS